MPKASPKNKSPLANLAGFFFGRCPYWLTIALNQSNRVRNETNTNAARNHLSRG